MAIDIDTDEMKRTVKTDDDARNMALKEVAKNTKSEFATVAEIMDKENEIRKAYGMKEITGYPVLEIEYSPATGQSLWKRLLGARIIRKPSMLPYGEAIYEEVENFDPSKRLKEIMPIVEKKIDEDFPGMNFSKEEKAPILKMIRLSVIKKIQLEAGSDRKTEIPAHLLDEPEKETKKPGRPKKE